MPTATATSENTPDPARDTADSELILLEFELADLARAREKLRHLWPRAPRAIERARIGDEMERTAVRINELADAITSARAQTLAGAAVQIRRLSAMMEGGDPAIAGFRAGGNRGRDHNPGATR